MNNLEIRSMHSPDVEIDTWEPENPKQVHFLLELEIGESGSTGADLFQVVILSRHIAENSKRKNRSPGKILIFDDFSWAILRREIDNIVASCRSDSWNKSIEKLCSHFMWEYDGYQLEQ